MRYSVLCLCLPACFAQTASTDAWLHNGLSAGFRYEVKLARNSFYLGNATGYSLMYSRRPLRWLALEAGLEQIPRPVGASVCCEYAANAKDELYLVPFGARYVLEPSQRRVRLSAGGGGAYLNYAVGHGGYSGAPEDASGWGGQLVAAADYGLTRSGRFRVGVTGRFYYIQVGPYQTGRSFTVGPDFTFSFR